MRIPEHKIEEVRASADIVDVISGFVRLKKAGRNFIGLCPFHQEKTPSFNVNPERGIYKCFGCGRGGNVFSFLMETERISFVEAVTELAERYHITIVPESGHTSTAAADTEVLYETTRQAARFFYDTLQKPEGVPGADYFKRRGWTMETQTRFGLGYASDSWDAFLRFARERGLSDDILETTGLIVRREGGRVYDRFRGRVVFPIFSASRKVIGFGARTLAAGEEPKYLNSPETPIYNKSRVLYGLSHAIPAIRAQDAVVIVEGYADVLSMSQAGITHVVATSGTALTPEQVRMLTRYTRNFFFLYDADSAGFAAMERGIDLMLEQDCDPRIVTLPQGEDPDSYVRKYGADGVGARLAEAVSFVDFITSRYERQGKLETPEGKTEAVRHVVGLLAKMEDRIRRELYVHHLAEKYRIYESVLYDELDTLLRRRKGDRSSTQRPARRPDIAPDVTGLAAELPRAEKEFLGQLFQTPSEVQREALHCVLPDAFTDPRSRALIGLLIEMEEVEGSVSLGEVQARLGDDLSLHAALADVLLTPDTSPRWTDVQTVKPRDFARGLVQSYASVLVRSIDVTLKRLETLFRMTPDDITMAGDKVQLEKLRNALLQSEALDFSDIARFQTVLFDTWGAPQAGQSAPGQVS